MLISACTHYLTVHCGTPFAIFLPLLLALVSSDAFPDMGRLSQKAHFLFMMQLFQSGACDVYHHHRFEHPGFARFVHLHTSVSPQPHPNGIIISVQVNIGSCSFLYDGTEQLRIRLQNLYWLEQGLIMCRPPLHWTSGPVAVSSVRTHSIRHAPRKVCAASR